MVLMQEDETPLIVAACRGYHQVVKALLEGGAAVQASQVGAGHQAKCCAAVCWLRVGVML